MRECFKPSRNLRAIQMKFDAIEKLTEQLLVEEARIMDIVKNGTSELANEVEQGEVRYRKLTECLKAAQID